MLEMTIEELDLSVRTVHCLKRAGINTVQELTQQTEADMMKVRNRCRQTLEEVKKQLADLGLGLRKEEVFRKGGTSMSYRKLGRTSTQRKDMSRDLNTDLLIHERIVNTEARE